MKDIKTTKVHLCELVILIENFISNVLGSFALPQGVNAFVWEMSCPLNRHFVDTFYHFLKLKMMLYSQKKKKDSNAQKTSIHKILIVYTFCKVH